MDNPYWSNEERQKLYEEILNGPCGCDKGKQEKIFQSNDEIPDEFWEALGEPKPTRHQLSEDEIMQIDIEAVAQMLTHKTLNWIMDNNYRGDIPSVLNGLYLAHKDEFSECEQKQMKNIIDLAMIMITEAMSLARKIAYK